MEYTIRPFASLDERAVERVALLHQSVMHNLLTDLGFPIVLRYYQIASRDPSVIGFCAVSSSGEIIGWTVGSPNPQALNASLRTQTFWFLKQMLRLLVTHPSVFLELLLSVIQTSEQQLPARTVELTYIGVASGYQGKGAGRALLNAFTEASRSSGYCSIELSTEKDNHHAQALYEKSGFMVKATTQEGRFERYRMERKLSV
jgi:ribosomal protein S18 acetylase RimI-like enzyme